MYIKIKTMDGKQSVMLTVSKMSQIEEVRLLIKDKLEVEPTCQRLFFRGKQMEDGYRLIDYGINVNDVVQLMIRAAPPPEAVKCEIPKEEAAEEKKPKQKKSDEEEVEDIKCEYYEVQDLVDAKDPFTSSWVEARIVKIGKPVGEKNPKTEYHVLYQGHERESPTPRSFEQIRPRAETIIHVDDLQVGEKVMVNYNMEDPKDRGLWYDAKITKLSTKSRTNKRLIVTLIMGEESDTEVNDCKIHFVKEVFEIPIAKKIVDQSANDKRLLKKGPPTKRESAPYCVHCKDNPEKKCKICGCHECGMKDNPDKQLMCDECDLPYHIYCLKPPLEEMPEVEEWYCPKCKNDGNDIVKAGEKLKESKKKAKAPSNVNKNTGRDWGRGMACAGRGKECTIVPSNHFGPIPGVDVGTTWRFRFQASEAGVHRPPVGGIHGREKEGAYSIVLSGGYEDDVDNGDSFYYTGSGGRDLTGNKRTAEQSCDQTLTRMNLALALNCNAPVNATDGAEAKDWRKGKPVRVLRKGSGDEKSLAKGKGPKASKSKHTTNFGPEIGVRYDGIYKIVKYWPEKGKSGHLVWRYILRRDDPVPPVWTPEGKKRVQELGLDQVIYPEGHLEAQEAKAQELEKNGGAGKRKTITELLQASADGQTAKKAKKAGYQLEKELEELVKADQLNAKMWDECREALGDTKQKFVTKVEERFLCICCQDVVCRPVTTPCIHNICLTCLQRSFKAEVYNCPSCRHELGKNMNIEVNEELSKALNAIFPGYENGR